MTEALAAGLCATEVTVFHAQIDPLMRILNPVVIRELLGRVRERAPADAEGSDRRSRHRLGRRGKVDIGGEVLYAGRDQTGVFCKIVPAAQAH